LTISLNHNILNTMNDDTREILLILQEECAEVTQAISKCFRFGPDQIKPGKDRTNISMLQEELGDLLAMIDLLVWNNVGVDWDNLIAAKKQKFEKLKQWSNLEL
jgi:NTP pyrophosphatase (non-canonical NTP hydrolase)